MWYELTPEIKAQMCHILGGNMLVLVYTSESMLVETLQPGYLSH